MGYLGSVRLDGSNLSFRVQIFDLVGLLFFDKIQGFPLNPSKKIPLGSSESTNLIRCCFLIVGLRPQVVGVLFEPI